VTFDGLFHPCFFFCRHLLAVKHFSVNIIFFLDNAEKFVIPVIVSRLNPVHIDGFCLTNPMGPVFSLRNIGGCPRQIIKYYFDLIAAVAVAVAPAVAVATAVAVAVAVAFAEAAAVAAAEAAAAAAAAAAVS